jgi:hypothetical protein
MDSNRIDFISSYCDRWCERCAFTERCSVFACKVAIDMCGDAEAGMELALGTPKSDDGSGPPTIGEQLLLEIENQMPTEAEMAEYRREKGARNARIAAVPIAQMSDVYMTRSRDWIDYHASAFENHSDPIVREAFAIVAWDSFLIHVKLRRALDGLDGFEHGARENVEDDPVQTDWNGSAKIALISIERSAHAWRTIGGAIGDGSALALGDALETLARSVLAVFPEAMAFRRPGFDDEGALQRSAG